MSDTQYKILLDLFHEYNEAFQTLAPAIRTSFLDRLILEDPGWIVIPVKM